MMGFRLIFLVAFAISIASISAFSQQYDSDLPFATEKQIQNDLKLSYEIKLSNQSPLHKIFFGEKKESAYKDFFTSRILQVGFDANFFNPYTMYVNPWQYRKMVVTLNYVKFEIPQIARISVMYHEARHAEPENDFWLHEECPTPFIGENGKPVVTVKYESSLEGILACDTKELGAYALGSVMLNNITRFCENCNEKVKMDAEIYAEDSQNRIIDSDARMKLKEDSAYEVIND